jgi:hypothetical protein
VGEEREEKREREGRGSRSPVMRSTAGAVL